MEGGRLGPAAKKFIDESDVARKAAASKIVRAIGIEHKQAYEYVDSTFQFSNNPWLIQELRNEERFVADFANGVVQYYEGR